MNDFLTAANEIRKEAKLLLNETERLFVDFQSIRKVLNTQNAQKNGSRTLQQFR